MSENEEVASIARRIVGGLVDVFVLWLLAMVIGALLGRGQSTLEEGQVGVAFEVGVHGWTAVAVFGVVFVLFALMEWKLGRTPGKFLAGTRVEGRDGQPPGLGAALLRNLLRYVDGIGIYLVGLVVIALNPDRQRLGDMVAGTRVVNVQRPEA